jgi:hypothetical protein
LHLQAYAANDPLELEPSVWILFEGARRNRYGEWADLQGHVFCERVNPIGVGTQGKCQRSPQPSRQLSK